MPPGAPIEDTAIWGYMSFAKYVSLLRERALFFARADLLRDKFEGSISRVNLAKPSELEPEVAKVIRSMTSKALQDFTSLVMLSCWCMGEIESVGLWERYAPGPEGIAVKSTYNRLRNCFSSKLSVAIGKVTYLDYEKDEVPVDTVFAPFFCKRKNFEDEHELRAGVHAVSGEPGTMRPVRAGAYVPVNLDTLVDAVYVAPEAPEWILEVVRSVTKLHGLGKEVKRSGISGTPLY